MTLVREEQKETFWKDGSSLCFILDNFMRTLNGLNQSEQILSCCFFFLKKEILNKVK